VLFVLAIGFGVAVVVYAMWRSPGWIGVLRAAAGVVVYGLVGYLWIVALFFSASVVEPMVSPLRAVGLDRVFALVLYFAPPLVAGLVTVRVLDRDRMSR
jgi:hypothetical protein